MSSLHKLQTIYQQLTTTDQTTLLSFAEFLLQRQQQTHTHPTPIPESHPRPPQETVIAAIKRLKKTYYMLDPATLLNETNTLLNKHCIQGHSAENTINELETLFTQKYENLKNIPSQTP